MDILKIFVSTLVVLIVTAIVFFGMYFLFPNLSDSVFGVSYAHGCTIDGVEERKAFHSTMDDMKSGIQDTMKTAAENVSAAAGELAEKTKDALPEVAEKVKDTDPSEIVTAAVDKVKDVVASADPETLGRKLSEAEEGVVDFFSNGKGALFLEELRKSDAIPDDFDIGKLAESEEGREILDNVLGYVKESGVELDDALSNADLHKMASGKLSEATEALSNIFKGGK